MANGTITTAIFPAMSHRLIRTPPLCILAGADHFASLNDCFGT